MKKYMIVTEDNYTFETASNLDLEVLLRTFQEQDLEYTIYEQLVNNEWVEAEFYCYHEYLSVASQGMWVEQCENMAVDPFGCPEHRSEGF